MSYQVLARKWRPQHFSDMIGQEHVLKALINALESNRLHHAYLFTGMRGVGKTTIARIFAKCLNCERVDTVTANPCGECATCRDIEAGRFFDLIEVDAASRTKVDETRELLENVPYAPTAGRYKVYLIDEVHMFSNHSFNALLKTLEEPPDHVKFLLATTDPQKVPVTVLSRCLQFNLKRMIPARLADYLENILKEESITSEPGALDLIARAADGSVRDSLSLVEQAAAFGDGAVKLGEVESMLGRVSVERLLVLIDYLADADVKQLFVHVNELSQYAPDFHELLGEILSLTHRIALLQSVPGSVEPDASDREQLQALASKISAEDIQLWYQIGMHARRDMPFAPDPREAFDMALLRMLAFAPQPTDAAGGVNGDSDCDADGRDVVGSAGRGASAKRAEAKGTGTGISASSVNATGTSSGETAGTALGASKAAIDPATESPAEASDESSVLNRQSRETHHALSSSSDRMAALDAALGRAPAPKKKLNAKPTDTSSADEAAAAPQKTTRSATVDAPANKEFEEKLPLEREHWPGIVRAMHLEGLPLQLAMHSTAGRFENGVLTLLLPKPAQHLYKPVVVEQLAESLRIYHGAPMKLTVDVTTEELVTPAGLQETAARQAQRDAENSIENDPLLAELLSRVDGEVTRNSVRPVLRHAENQHTETTTTNRENT